MREASRFVDLLSALDAHGVEYVVVGGVAAVLHGAPIITRDLDILLRRSPENVDRTLGALRELKAVYRGDPRNLTPGPTHLIGPGHHLLQTRYGDLDVRGTIEERMTYDDVIGSAVTFTLAEHAVRVLDLRRLIAAKEQANRPNGSRDPAHSACDLRLSRRDCAMGEGARLRSRWPT